MALLKYFVKRVEKEYQAREKTKENGEGQHFRGAFLFYYLFIPAAVFELQHLSDK